MMINNIEELHKKLEQLIAIGHGKKPIHLDGQECEYTIDSVQKNTNPDIEPDYYFLMEGERIEIHFEEIDLISPSVDKVKKVKLTGVKPFLPYWTPRFLRVLEFRIRTKIFKQKRYLIDKWRIK